jgi:hypothetical protein
MMLIQSAVWENLHEAEVLMLDNNHAKNELRWEPRLSFNETFSWTAD